MNPELLRLAIIVAVGLALMYFYKQWESGKLGIKNEGTLTMHAGSGGETEDSSGEVVANAVAAQKRVQNSQIDNISEDERYMMKVKQDQLYQNNTNVLPRPQMSNLAAPQGNFQPAQLHNFSQMDCFPKDQLNAADLIPREDVHNTWNQSNPPVQGALSNVNFVDSGHHFGLNTVGQSLKNPNLQLRSDPLIPQRSVGPWNQSTVESDTNRRPFEIGGF